MKKETPVKGKKHISVKSVAVVAKPSKCVLTNPPTIGHEASRQQVMCRSGQAGKGSCVGFKYKDYGRKAGAWKKAQDWLRMMQAKYAKHA